jgi:hypothetical protein
LFFIFFILFIRSEVLVGCFEIFENFRRFVQHSQHSQSFPNSQDLLSFCKKKVTKKNFSPFKSFRFLKPDADYGAFAATSAAEAASPAFAAPAYMRRLKAALPHASSLRSCRAVTQSPLCHLLR